MLERKDVLTDDLMMAPKVLTKDLQGVYDVLVNISKVSRDIKLPGAAGGAPTLSGTSGGSQGTAGDGAVSSTKKLKEETALLTLQQKELAKVQQQIAILTAKDTAEYRAQAKELAALKQQLKEKTVLGERDAKAITKQNASLTELKAALAANRVEYAKYVTEEQRATKEGQALLKIIQEQDTAVKELDDSTGVHTAHVGDYKGQMKALKDELKLAKDEMVGVAATLGEDSAEFAAAAQKAADLADQIEDIGDAAKAVKGDTSWEKLGSQFGLLKDKLKNLDFKGANVQLQNMAKISKGMTFKETTAGLGEVGKGFLNLGKIILANPFLRLAAIVIGIVVAVVKLKDSIAPLKIAFNAVGEAMDWVIEKGKQFTDWIGLTEFATEEFARKQANSAEKLRDKLVKRYDDEIKVATAAGEKTIAIEKAKARAIQDTAEQQARALKKIIDMQHLTEGEKKDNDDVKRYKELVDLAHDASVDLQVLKTQEVKAIKDLQKGLVKDTRDLEKFRLQESIKLSNEIVNNEAKTNEQRIAAALAAEKKKNALIRKERDGELSELDGIGDIVKATAIREKANAAIADNAKATQKIIIGLMLKALQEQAAILEEESNNVKNSWEERIQLTTQGSEKQIEILDFQLKKQLISQEDYQRAYLKIEKDTTDKVVKLILERQDALAAAQSDKQGIGSNSLLTDLEKSFEAGAISLKDYLKERGDIIKQAKRNELQLELEFYKELSAIQEQNGIDSLSTRKKISELELLTAQESNQKLLEGQMLLDEKLKELRKVGVESALQIIDNLNEEEDMRREERLEKIAAQLEYDLELAGDNEDKKLQLKKRAEVEEAKVRKEQAAADRKRAIFEKAVAATSIGINTAKGIGVALGYGPPVGIILAVVMAALGAIQLAAVLSKPIPSYAKGTKNHPGGAALVAEAGSEIIKEPGRAPYLQKEPNILDLPPHTQVIPHGETMQALAIAGASRYDSRQVQESYDMHRLENRVDQLNHTVKNKKEVHINFSKRGVEAMFEKAGSKMKMLNDFYY